MGKALYRKYRSKSLGEVVGQEHITTTLENAVKRGLISHAYLFTGPRGVGKTSVARILAHAVNDLDYDEDQTHLDIIEIDAASNRRIDEIRTLRERVHNAPSSAKYKVYIIDEVHMLTKEAFNALLKTLEEPPAHAIFILATTESHKLPETIISRTQRFSFKPIERSAAVKHLRHIADQEKIDINDEALELIAEHGDGSFRDSISLLDQMSTTGAVVDLAAAQRMLGIAPADSIANIFAALANGQTEALLQNLQGLLDQGYQAPQIAKQVIKQLRTGLIKGQPQLPVAEAAKLIHQLIDVPASHDPAALLEIILLGAALASPTAKQSKVQKPEPVTVSPPKVDVIVPSEPTKSEDSPTTEPEPEATPSETSPEATASLALDENTWQQILQAVRQKHTTLYAVARMATPIFNDNELTLCFSFPFHQKQFSEAKNKELLRDVIVQVTGASVNINCIVDKAKTQPKITTKNEEKPVVKKDGTLDTISNIFGDAEVLE